MKQKKLVEIKSFVRSSKFGGPVKVRSYVRDTTNNVGAPKKPGMVTAVFRLHKDTLCLIEEAMGEYPNFNRSQFVEEAIQAFARAALR